MTLLESLLHFIRKLAEKIVGVSTTSVLHKTFLRFLQTPQNRRFGEKWHRPPLSLNVRRKDTTSTFRQKFNWGYDSPFFCDILNFISRRFWRKKGEREPVVFEVEIDHDSLMSHLDGAITGQDSWATKSYCVKPHGASRRVSFVF